MIALLASIGAAVSRLSRRDRADCRSSPDGARRPRSRRPSIPRLILRADGRYRLFFAAGRGADGDLHRHGAGAAILYRVQPLRRRGRGGDGRRAVGDARTRAGHRRTDGRGPGRGGDGGRDRHDARHRPDRRADDACRPIRCAIWCCRACLPGWSPCRCWSSSPTSSAFSAAISSRPTSSISIRPAYLTSTAAISRPRPTSSPAWSRRRCSALSSR